MNLIFVREKLREKLLANAFREKGCLVWKGTRGKKGYGIMQFMHKRERKAVAVTRLILAMDYDIDLNDYSWMACHTCDNPPCIDPEHLYVGNASTNKKDDWKRNPATKSKLFPKEFCIHGHNLKEVGLSKRWLAEKGRYQWQCKRCKCDRQKRYEIKRRNKQ